MKIKEREEMVRPTSRKVREKRGWEGEREITCGYKGWGFWTTQYKYLRNGFTKLPSLKIILPKPFLFILFLFYKCCGVTLNLQ